MKILPHAHTRFSEDGHLSVSELAGLAKAKGFDGVLVSDHFEHLDRERFARLVDECVNAGSCMLIPGYERDWNGYHICAFGVSTWFADPDLETWAAQVRHAGGIVCLAHPTRYQHVVPAQILEQCDAVEVWNSKRPYDGIVGPNPKAYRLLGNKRFPMVGQDLHRRRDVTGLGMEIQTAASAARVLDALREQASRIVSDFIPFDREPGAAVALGLGALQWVRPRLWAIPVSGYKAVRSIRKRNGTPAVTRS